MSKLALRPFSADNADQVLAWRNSERVRANSINDTVIGKEEHLRFLEKLVHDPSRAYFVVELSGEPVGTINFSGIGGDTVTWGCYIGHEKVIPGLFIALVFLAADRAFTDYATRVLRSEVAAHNLAPQQVNRHLGIASTGTRTCVAGSGRELLLLQYELGKDDWDRTRPVFLARLPTSMRRMIGGTDDQGKTQE
jgi:RimJ/RimL family protein N-acetyltransferase